jgi:hypothetical protein
MKISKKVFFLLVAASIACSCQIFAGRRRGKAPPHRRSKTPHRRFGGGVKTRDQRLFGKTWTFKMAKDIPGIKNKRGWNKHAKAANKIAKDMQKIENEEPNVREKFHKKKAEYDSLERELKQKAKRALEQQGKFGPYRFGQFRRMLRRIKKENSDQAKKLKELAKQHDYLLKKTANFNTLHRKYREKKFKLNAIYEKDTKKK